MVTRSPWWSTATVRAAMRYRSASTRAWIPPPTGTGSSNGTGFFTGQRRLLSFNAGGCCPPATRNNVDDVGFTEAILSVLQEKLPIDARRLYATGMSNGG